MSRDELARQLAQAQIGGVADRGDRGESLLNWVEIDAGAVRDNLVQFRERLGDATSVGAVVKSNAYGHGMLEVARLAELGGVDWLCVNNVEEAVALRKAGRRSKILVLGYIEIAHLDAVVEYDLRPVVYNVATVRRLSELAAGRDREVGLHVKIETGTFRQGVLQHDLGAFVDEIRELPGLRVEGVTTHFANIEDTTQHEFAESQIAAFTYACEQVQASVPRPVVRHAACSAAALLFTRTHLDMARIGISLYGLWPSRETYVSCLDRGKPALELRPALTWKTRVAQIKDLPEGAFVGYGCSWRATRPSRIAVLPVGYFEGYDRGLSNVAHVLLRGRRAPIRGRVCMNMCMVDVTDIEGAQVEDEVVLLGSQRGEQVTAEQLAAWCGTISYEVVSRIHPGLPRLLVGEPAAGGRT